MLETFRRVFIYSACSEILRGLQQNQENVACSFHKSMGYGSFNSTLATTGAFSSNLIQSQMHPVLQNCSHLDEGSPEMFPSSPHRKSKSTLNHTTQKPFIVEYLEELRMKQLKSLCRAFSAKNEKEMNVIVQKIKKEETEGPTGTREGTRPLKRYCHGFKLFQELITCLFLDIYSEFLPKETQNQLFSNHEELFECVLEVFFNQSLEQFQILVYFFIYDEHEMKQSAFAASLRSSRDSKLLNENDQEIKDVSPFSRPIEELKGFPRCVSVTEKYSALCKVMSKLIKAVEAVSDNGMTNPDLMMNALVYCIKASKNQYLLFEMRYMDQFLPRSIKENSMHFAMFEASIAFLILEGKEIIEEENERNPLDISFKMTTS